MPEDPHAAAPNEEPLNHLGEVIEDPWSDDTQTDWGTAPVPEED